MVTKIFGIFKEKRFIRRFGLKWNYDHENIREFKTTVEVRGTRNRIVCVDARITVSRENRVYQETNGV